MIIIRNVANWALFSKCKVFTDIHERFSVEHIIKPNLLITFDPYKELCLFTLTFPSESIEPFVLN